MDLINEPNPPFPVEIIDTQPVEVSNPFSGQKTTLQPTAIAVYDCIKGAEMTKKFRIVTMLSATSITMTPQSFIVGKSFIMVHSIIQK